MDKTHAMRVLDAKKIPYTAKVYDDSGAFHAGTEAAALLGADAASVYKTLVVLRENDKRAKPMMVMVPVAAEVDLKALASSIGAKKLRMAKQREAEELTGMQVGGISALGLKAPTRFEVLLDESARRLERIHVSAGARGIDLEVAIDDLLTATSAHFVRASNIQARTSNSQNTL
jgi:Cys-tRNA(Pro)/Cys-tRNA(Cys) deacylase